MKTTTIIYILLLFEVFSLKFPFEHKENKATRKLQELSDDIIILHTNDVHCGIMDKIGYDGLSLYKKEMQKKYKYVITVDVGDHIQGGTIGLLSKGEDIINIMNQVGYDVATLGNHEFDYGVEQLEVCRKKLKCDYICANYCLKKDKKPIYAPYKIITAGNKRIGFIGVATPQTISKTFLHAIMDEETNDLKYDFLTDNDGQELFDTIQKYIDEVRAQADYVIILAHLGKGGDSLYQYSSEGFLENIKGVDAVLDGHTHLTYNITSKDKDDKDIPLTQTGTKLNNIGVLKISSTDKITQELISEVPEPDDKTGASLINRSGQRWVDSAMYDYLNDKMDLHSAELNEKIGYTDFDLMMTYTPPGESTIPISRKQEVNLGDLVADAIRYIGDGEISMINAGSIRADLFQGDITYDNILDILPFSADIIVKEVSGKDILDALEFGMKDVPNLSPRFLQVSGISFKVNLNISSSIEVDKDEMFVRVYGKRRVHDVKVGRKKLDLYKLYRVSFDNYIAGGGDGFSMFAPYKEKESTLYIDNQALITYIKDELNGVIPDRYNSTSNRIVFTSNFEYNYGIYLKSYNLLVIMLLSLLLI